MTDTQPDYYLSLGNAGPNERAVLTIDAERDINTGPVQVTLDNGQRTPVLMLELHRDRVVVGSWPEGEEWVVHMSVWTDRETKVKKAPDAYTPPGGLTLRVGSGWEGTYANTIRTMLNDALVDGDVEIEALANLADDIGDAVCRGHITALTDDVLHFRGGREMPLDDIRSITLLD